MSKGKRRKGATPKTVVCEAFVDEHGHLVLFVLDHGKPVIYRQFWCSRRHRNDQGRFIAKGFRRSADQIVEIIEHPEEELAISKPNCDPELYTKLSVGCSKKNPGVILRVMQEDRDALMEEYGISEEDLEKDSKKRIRRRSFFEWLFETETEEEHYKRVAEKKAAKKAKHEVAKGTKKDEKKDEKSDE